MSSTRLLASLLALVAFGNLGSFCEATVACSSTQECESTHMEGSRCVKGVCVANSYHDGGCLKSLLPDWHKIRVCNSDDPPSSAEKGFCRPSPLDYTEVRRLSQNWESAFFGTWILQILLSEILDVPVSVETGFPELNVDFYNIDSSFDYGGANDWDAMSTGTLVGDCRDLKTYDPEEYQACGHVIPEVWSENLPTIRQYEKDGVLEAPVALGALAAQIWFVPKFTVERDPTLMNYIGLQGEENRRKLAERFKRPTSWKDYCEEVSATKCSDEDEVASRPPRTEGEESSMFAEGLYTGHFRSSEKNDCEINNSTCTGHISDYPCGWNSFIKQQTYHLNIPLESSGPEASGGYSYSQLTQIWAAANATKSDVMMLWWFPDALYTTYLGTDAEFTPVVLPPPTQSCLDARINVNDRCGDDVALKVGSAEGSCDNPPQSLQKVIGATLRDLSEDPSVPVELWSPAYEAIMNYQINELQLGEIFDERKNYVARETTCRWVAENIDLVMSFVPKSYPRVVEKEDISDSGASIAALAFACLAALMVLVSFYFTVQQRKTRVMYNAQVEFMYLLLGGTLLISLGALLMTREVTKTLCSAIPWTVHVGYILVVFPVVLRVDATNCLLNSGKQLQRVRLDTGKHFGWVAVGVVAVAVHMVTWTILDPIQAESDYRLTSDINEFGESILSAASKCSSESDLWLIGITAVVTLFLLYGLVLSFMASRVKEDSNETKNLAVLILVQFIAAIIRLSGLFMRESFDSENTMANRSLLLSIEVILVLLIFVIPKLLEKSDTDRDLWTISHEAKASERREQLVDWNVQVLTKLIKQIVARRNATFAGRSLLAPSTYLRGESGEQVQNSTSISSSLSLGNGRPLDEVKEIIKLPDFDKRVARRQQIAESIELPAAVIHELKLFVVAISSLYQDNPFHNFAYASHVVMSTMKYLGRIVDSSGVGDKEKTSAAAKLHDATYGITSDPLTQLECVFSALIHDADHPGVPNQQFIKENKNLAAIYNNRSVAEQNSIDLAWGLLMDVRFKNLLAAICGTETEMIRFRQLVVNAVIATDLGDKELKTLRNHRWDKAFLKDSVVPNHITKSRDDANRKATIVIEHLIQASDVSHTMQHWEVYREWNENLFMEMYHAYRNGRSEKNPAEFWYDGEIGFFDFYAIPLSKKLSECGVFGVSSDENLNYATENRRKWVTHGKDVVVNLLSKAEERYGSENRSNGWAGGAGGAFDELRLGGE